MEDISTKASGDTLSAREFNQIPTELENAITSMGIALSSADLSQLSKALTNAAVAADFYNEGGTANARLLTGVGPRPTPTAYFDGMRVRFYSSLANTATSVTVNVAGLGVKQISGLAIGDLPAGGNVVLVYRSVPDRFERQFAPVNPRGRGYNVGDVFETALTSAPPGSFALDGSTVTNMRTLYPDLWASSANGTFFTASGDNGILSDSPDFIRGKGASTRAVGEFQNDALQNITGSITVGDANNTAATGAFTMQSGSSMNANFVGGSAAVTTYDFNASRVVRTADQTQPKSQTALRCLYHGVFN